jgi:hypothetical protein
MRLAFFELSEGRPPPWRECADLLTLVPNIITIERSTQDPRTHIGYRPPFSKETVLVVTASHAHFAASVGEETGCSTIVYLEANQNPVYTARLAKRFKTPYRLLQPKPGARNILATSSIALFGPDEDEAATHVITKELNFDAVKAVTRGKRTAQPVLLDPAKKDWESVLFEDFLTETTQAPPVKDLCGFSFTRIGLLELD